MQHDITTQLEDGLVTLQDSCVALNRSVREQAEHQIGEMQAARRLMDDAEGAITMEAYASGAIDGKNAERRGMQLNAYLTNHDGYQSALARLDNALAMQASLQAAYDNAEVNYKTACYAARSRIAMAGLEAAMVGRHEEEYEEVPFR